MHDSGAIPPLLGYFLPIVRAHVAEALLSDVTREASRT
jgi:hypothetical protein